MIGISVSTYRAFIRERCVKMQTNWDPHKPFQSSSVEISSQSRFLPMNRCQDPIETSDIHIHCFIAIHLLFKNVYVHPSNIRSIIIKSRKLDQFIFLSDQNHFY